MLVFLIDVKDEAPCTVKPWLYNVHFVSYIWLVMVS